MRKLLKQHAVKRLVIKLTDPTPDTDSRVVQLGRQACVSEIWLCLSQRFYEELGEIMADLLVICANNPMLGNLMNILALRSS